MDGMESEGKTVAEAVEAALKRLGLRRDQVEVQILQEASSGFMGLGARPARVRITEKRWGEGAAEPAPARKTRENGRGRAATAARPPAPQPQPERAEEREEDAALPAMRPEEACAKAQSLTREILSLMSFDAAATASWDAVQERVLVSVTGPDAERLASGDGRQLEALQLVVAMMLSRRRGEAATGFAVQIDANGFWERKEKEILAQAEAGAEEARRTGKPVRLPPMDSSMRRLIHRHLAGHPDIQTGSEGEGPWRKIVLRVKRR